MTDKGYPSSWRLQIEATRDTVCRRYGFSAQVANLVTWWDLVGRWLQGLAFLPQPTSQHQYAYPGHHPAHQNTRLLSRVDVKEQSDRDRYAHGQDEPDRS